MINDFLCKRHSAFAAVAPLPVLLIGAGVLAVAGNPFPPWWFFFILWIFFSLLLYGILKKKSETPVLQPEKPHADEKMPEPLPAPQPEALPAVPGIAPFVPPMREPAENAEKETSEPLPPEVPAPPVMPEEIEEPDWKCEVIIDSKILKRHAILGEDFVRKLFDIFVEDSPARLGDMRRFFDSENFMELRNSAHALKGSAAAIGAKRLSSICREIQYRCDDGKLDDISFMIDEAGKIFEETSASVKSYDFSVLEH